MTFVTCTCIPFGHYLNTLPPSLKGILSQRNSKPNQQGIKDRLDRYYLSRFNSVDPIAIYHSRNQKHGIDSNSIVRVVTSYPA